MVLANKKKIFIIAGLTLLPLVMAEVALISSNWSMKPSIAEQETFVLNNDNAPTLSAGEGTMVDEKNVTWEYHNASDNPSGHVSLGHEGYFGISSSTSWGFTGIQSITVNFTKGTDGELWLLKSTNGTSNEWSEVEQLTTGQATTNANGWRYIRFYYYDTNSTTANISFVTITYSCEGISSTDDVDLATVDNVTAITALEAHRETDAISSRGDSTEAVRFTSSGSGTASFTFSLKENDLTVGDIQLGKVEFDFYHADNNTKPGVQIMNNNAGVGTKQDSSKSCYKVTNVDNYWWHIEVHISAMIPPMSGWNSQEQPIDKNKPVNGIKIFSGICVIDNLKITYSPSSLGNFNGTNTMKLSDAKPYWFKISWVGTFHSAVFTFNRPIAEQVEMSETVLSPFYITPLEAGSVEVTATLVVGYNRQVLTIRKSFTIS